VFRTLIIPATRGGCGVGLGRCERTDAGAWLKTAGLYKGFAAGWRVGMPWS